jgi:L-serine/L-threonine ammonia-lyase
MTVGGNAGIAAAYAGRKLGIPVTVVVPKSAPDLFLGRIRNEGADVIVYGEVGYYTLCMGQVYIYCMHGYVICLQSWTEANQYSLDLASQPGHVHVHPFDHPDIWQGHSSIVAELNHQLHGAKPDAIILSVGGGGLLNGVVEGLQAVGWGDVPVVAVETEGADSFAAACKAGKLVTLPAITSIAKCLGAKTISQRTWDLTKEHPIHSCVVSDKATVDACLKFLDDHHHAVDPACGAALAAVYHPQQLCDLQQQGKLHTPLNSVVVIVCGGHGVNLKLLDKWKKDFGL